MVNMDIVKIVMHYSKIHLKIVIIITADVSWEYHKIISKKEYKSKVRDKYDEKVLNIVLKQIVNDDFKW
jgi:hypothetical protein